MAGIVSILGGIEWWWFVSNWIVPIFGPPGLVWGLRQLSKWPHWGTNTKSSTKWPDFEESLDVVGWLFLSLAMVASAFGDLATAHVSPSLGITLAGLVVLPGILAVYVFTLQAKGAVQQANPPPPQPPGQPQNPPEQWKASRQFRWSVLGITFGAALFAATIRANLPKSGGTHAARESTAIETASRGTAPSRGGE